MTCFRMGVWLTGDVRPMKDWDRSVDGEAEQQKVVRDELGDPVLVDGEPQRLWQVEVMDGDLSLTKDKSHTVTIVSAVQPVPPARPEGADVPFVRVALVGLTMRERINRDGCKLPWQKGRAHVCRAKLVRVFEATGMVALTAAPAPAKTATAAGNGRGGSG